MEKYLQGRIAAYAVLFTEICPPIPQEHKERFSINGQLMPGYTVEAPESDRPDQGQVDALLNCLDDIDMAEPPVKPPEKYRKEQRKTAAKKKHIPTR